MLDGMPAVFALPSTAGIICFNPGTLAKIGKKMPQNKKLTFSAVFDDGTTFVSNGKRFVN